MTTDPTMIIQRYFGEVWSAGDERAQAQLIAPEYSGYWLSRRRDAGNVVT